MNLRITKRLRPVGRQSTYRVASYNKSCSGHDLLACLDSVGRPGWHEFTKDVLDTLETGAVGRSEIRLEVEYR